MEKKKPTKIGEHDFIKIESGTFNMGELCFDKNADENIETNRQVLITNDFYMQTTPVTTKQYYMFLSETGYEHEYRIEIWDGSDWIIGPDFLDINGRGDYYPVVGVSYIDANQYIKWASEKYGVNFRLPYEAEFEFASRDNCKCRAKCKYANKAERLGLVRKENEMPECVPREVKKGIKTSFGLYDMHGLIWQWCSDWFFYYDLNECVDPKGPAKMPEYAPWNGEKLKPGKVIRGGSFSYPWVFSRCSNRHFSFITDRNYNLGFRLCI